MQRNAARLRFGFGQVETRTDLMSPRRQPFPPQVPAKLATAPLLALRRFAGARASALGGHCLAIDLPA